MAFDRRPLLFVLAGTAVALVSVPAAAAAGAPYLSFGTLSPWVVSFAIGLFTALLATPFAIHSRLAPGLAADARWERALLLWGAVALVVLAVSVLCGLPSGFDTGALGGALAVVGVADSALVLATLTVWLLGN